MKSLIIILLVICSALSVLVITNGLAMILIGSIGHLIDVPVYKYMSFWEVAGIGVIFGFVGYNSK